MSSGQYTETAILNCLVVSNLLLFNHRNHHQPATVSPMNFSWIFSVLSEIHRHGHALQHYINNIYIYIYTSKLCILFVCILFVFHICICYIICMHMWKLLHVYMSLCIYMYMYICVYMYVCIYIYMCVYVYIYIYTYTGINVYMYICTYVLSYVYIHTSTCSISYYPWTNSVVFA